MIKVDKRDRELGKKFEELMEDLPEPDTSGAWNSVMKKRKKRIYKKSVIVSVLIAFLVATVSVTPGAVEAVVEFIQTFSVQEIDENVKLHRSRKVPSTEIDKYDDKDDEIVLREQDESVFDDLETFSENVDHRFAIPEIENENFLKAKVHKIKDLITEAEIRFSLHEEEVRFEQSPVMQGVVSARLTDGEIKTKDIEINDKVIDDLTSITAIIPSRTGQGL